MNLTVLIKGVILIFLTMLIYRHAFLFFKRNQIKQSLLFIVFGGLVLRIWCLLDPFLHTWDERYHALVAKNMVSNPLIPMLYRDPVLPYNYQDWSSNHIWLHKQPPILWLMAASLKIFGNVEWAVRIPSLLLSIICIYLTFLIAKFFADTKIALLAAFLHSINGLVIEVGAGRHATDHIDSTFLFFVELSLWFVILYIQQKKYVSLLCVGLSMGLALLTKSMPALITIPIFVLLTFEKDGLKKVLQNSILILFVGTIVYLPWQIYIYNAFPQEAIWENSYNTIQHFKVSMGEKGGFFWHIDNARIIWNELIYLVFIWFGYRVSKRFFDKKILALMLWILVPYLFFSIVATKMSAYIMFTAPAIFIIESMFYWELINRNDKYQKFYRILAAVLIILAARFCLERVKPFENQNKEEEVWTSKFKGLKNLDSKTVVFGEEHFIEAMFYSDGIFYAQKPDLKTMNDVKNKGYKVLVKSNDGVYLPFQ
jgi:4-amino-4-deoxy-L-arabinose transferase-like glycosyltransferase